MLDVVLGPRGRRHDAVVAVEKLLRLELSSEQLDVLHGLGDPLTVVNGVVGSGKTTLMTAIVAMFTLHPCEDATLFMAVPTRRMVQDLHSAIGSHGVDMTFVATSLGVSVPGDDHSWDPDYLASSIDDIGHYEQDIMAAIDRALSLGCVPTTARQTPATYRQTVSIPDPVTYQRLMALRHEHLDLVLYSKAAETTPNRRPRVFISTISFLHKLQGATGLLPRRLQEVKHKLLIVDNFHHCSMQGLMTTIAPFDCVILAGDKTRQPPSDWLDRRRVLPEPRGPRKVSATAWLSDVGGIRQFSLTRTYSIGKTVLACLEKMCPNTWPATTSAMTGDTLVFPFIFPWLSDHAEVGDSPQVANSHSVFVHAAVTVALELLWGKEDEPVLCLAFFPRLLDHFRDWLYAHLDEALDAVAHWTDCARPRPGGEHFDLELLERTGRLVFLTVDKADDVTVPVAVLLALRHHMADYCWAGSSLLDRTRRVVSLTRATKRLYVFAEDLRRWVFAPHPATARTTDIIRAHNLQLQLSLNGGDNSENLPEGDDEFECQAEWSSLLWWLLNHQQGSLRAGHDHVWCRQYGATMPWAVAPVFSTITAQLCPLVCMDLARFGEAVLGMMAEHHLEWVRALRRSPASGPAPSGSLYRPHELVAYVQEANFIHETYHQAWRDLVENRCAIAAMWRTLAIDALTVHVVNSNKVNVMIPLNVYLCDVACGHGLANAELHKICMSLVSSGRERLQSESLCGRLGRAEGWGGSDTRNVAACSAARWSLRW